MGRKELKETTNEILENYKPREPEETVLYEAIHGNLSTFLEQVEKRGQKPLPRYVKKELEAFLKCGIKRYIGYSEWECPDCWTPRTIPHSCKMRGFCPACGGRRMCQNAANITDHVLPKVAVRQWVVSLPFELRYWVAADSDLLDEINIIINKTIGRYYREKVRAKGAINPHFGGVSFIQRSGGSININPHWHSMFLEGAYDEGIPKRRGPRFFEAGKPTNEEVAKVTEEIATKVIAHLIKKGMLKEEEDFCREDPNQQEDPMQPIRQASLRNYVVCGERAGQEVRRVGRSFGEIDQTPELKGDRCYSINGFSVHANTSVKKNQLQEKERLLRYMARPPLSLDRLSMDENGDIIWELKNAYHDGTQALRFSGLELTEKVAGIIPPPWKNLTRYFGCLAPNSKIRSQIVPKPAKLWDNKRHHYWIPWAQLLARVFEIEIRCEVCGGPLSFVRAVGPKTTGPPTSTKSQRMASNPTCSEIVYSSEDIDIP